MEKLEITRFGTIKGFQNEISINDFLHLINKSLNKPLICRNGLHYYYKVARDAKDYDKYIINQYELDIKHSGSYYPILKKSLDDFCIKSKENDDEKLISQEVEMSSFENIKSAKDIKKALKYLRKRKKHFIKHELCLLISPMISIITFIVGIKLIGSLNFLVCATGFINILISVFAGTYTFAQFDPFFEKIFYDTTSSFDDYLDARDMTKHKIKYLEEGLKKSRINDYSYLRTPIQEEVENNNTNNNQVVQYMQEIEDLAKSLPSKERYKVIREILVILDDYTSKATKLRNAGTTGLILDDEMQKVLMETFGKLSSLYLEVNDMKNAQKESKVSIDECQKYREEVNQRLATLSFEEEKGQSRVMRQ